MEEKKVVVNLDAFTPRDYQVGALKALDNGVKNLVLVNHRRSGKDLLSLNIVLREAFKRRGLYLYVLPTKTQANNIIWKGMTKEGMPFLDYIPKALIRAKHQVDKSIELINGSIIRLAGSNDFDALRGVNPVGIIFSEFAYQHAQAWPTLSPVLLENGGFCIFQSTPFGENHFYDMYQAAQRDKEFYSELWTVDDTEVITPEQIQREVELGIISPDMVQQEYYCDFTVGAVGSYYATYVNELYLREQIGVVPWEKGKQVFTAWDLGVDDQTVIIMFQLHGANIHIIDVYANSNKGLEHYTHYLQSLPYTWGGHIGPHDTKVRDISNNNAETRLKKLRDLGFKMKIAPKKGKMAAIEAVRTKFNRLWIDERNCRKLIKALRDYRKKWNSDLRKYSEEPLHDENSDYADALKYLILGLHLVQEGMTVEDIELLKHKALYGENTPGGFPFKGMQWGARDTR